MMFRGGRWASMSILRVVNDRWGRRKTNQLIEVGLEWLSDYLLIVYEMQAYVFAVIVCCRINHKELIFLISIYICDHILFIFYP